MSSGPLIISEGRGTPIFRLPPELLARVFLLAKYQEDLERLCERDDAGAPSESQTVYIRVCSLFRAVALSTAALWAIVTVDPSVTIHRVRAYCSRSAAAPLDVIVSLPQRYSTDLTVRDNIFEMLEIVVAESYRWRKLAISLGRDMISQRSIIHLLGSCPTPMLQHVDLIVESVDKFDMTVLQRSPLHPTLFNRTGSNISFLRLRGLAVHIFRPPLDNLAVLHIDHTSAIHLKYDTFRDLLMASKHLSHLSIYGDTVNSEEWPVISTPATIILLPSLESLRIRGTDGVVFSGVLKNIDAPRLHSLVLKELQETDLAPQMAITLPQVKELTFCDFDLSEKAYESLYHLFPSIQKFTLLSSSIGVSKVAKTLCDDGPMTQLDPPVPWPHLSTITSCFDERDDPWIVEMVLRDRQSLGCPIVELEFITEGDSEEVLEWLEGVDEKGMFEGALITTIDALPPWPVGMPSVDINDVLFN